MQHSAWPNMHNCMQGYTKRITVGSAIVSTQSPLLYRHAGSPIRLLIWNRHNDDDGQPCYSRYIMYAYKAHAMPHIYHYYMASPLPSPLPPLPPPLLVGKVYNAAYLCELSARRRPGKGSDSAVWYRQPCVFVDHSDHTDLSETNHTPGQPVCGLIISRYSSASGPLRGQNYTTITKSYIEVMAGSPCFGLRTYQCRACGLNLLPEPCTYIEDSGGRGQGCMLSTCSGMAWCRVQAVLGNLVVVHECACHLFTTSGPNWIYFTNLSYCLLRPLVIERLSISAAPCTV